jgi:predicted ATP-dependent endonuclease of OLD family
MLSEDIRIDLHIHSNSSKYKEEDKVVDNSTTENVEHLLNILDKEENQITMFSFTDHNRFNSELYSKTKKLLNLNEYTYLKQLLAGVEFDVLLDNGMKPCHILTIFNANTEDEYKKIEKIIKENYFFTKRDGYYTRQQYEEILVKVGIESLLIVCQRKDLSNQKGNHTSLSDSAYNPFEYLKFGYFDALEYQKPGVEGILRNNLTKLDLDVALVLGSDCHDWSCYPQHSKKIEARKNHYSVIRSLPSFKGLLLSLTSPGTRFKRKPNNHSNYISHLKVSDKLYPLANGINAIIGENGSGKSLLIDMLTKKDRQISKYYTELIEINEMSFDKKAISRSQIVIQSEIIKNKNEGSVFGTEGSNLYKDITHTTFENAIKQYSSWLHNKTKARIKFYENKENLSNVKHSYDESKIGNTYFINVTKTKNYDRVTNIHKSRLDNLKIIIDLLTQELAFNYYTKDELDDLQDALNSINKAYNKINEKFKLVDFEQNVKNIIVNKIDSYNLNKKQFTTTEDTHKEEYEESRQTLIDSITGLYKQKIEIQDGQIFTFPKDINGSVSNKEKGFIFTRIAKYHMQYLEDSFFSYLFNQNYQTIKELDDINDNVTLASAVKNAGSNIEKIDSSWKTNTDKFIEDMKKTDDYIYETGPDNSQIGNTLGEMSLVYYKFKTFNSTDWDILIIDQPEDNISNPKIKDALINYFNGLRDQKQIIFVTHNPLLVINQDVDNVIYLEKHNNKIEVISGCLEDEENKILDLVANKMDGGVDTLEKRLKYYGKKN